MTDFGVLKPYDVRQVWQGEDGGFSRWLGENLDRLGAALGMNLARARPEAAPGTSASGLVAHDALRDRPVVIEAQLDETDHDHLGRLVTYAAGVEACAAVWIAPTFGDPHRAAVAWLNNHTGEGVEFFAVTLEAMQIDDSRPALSFKAAVFPNSWQKTLLDRHDGSAEDRDAYFYRFNEAVLADLREARTFAQLPAARSLSEVMLHTTHGGVRYGTAFSRGILRAGLWITFPDAVLNRAIFERLRAQKRDLESALGGADLEWDFSPERRGQIVTMNHIGVNREDDSQIPALAKWASDGLARMKRVFEPCLDRVVPEAKKALKLPAGVAV
ncbi:MAG: DUF4268 domain-containing protein [Candidatus Tumulicola sp.]